jgi:hypothetical protein
LPEESFEDVSDSVHDDDFADRPETPVPSGAANLFSTSGSPTAAANAAAKLFSISTPSAAAETAIAPSDTDEVSADANEASLQRLASEIEAAIAASGGIGNLHVTCMKDRVILTGIAGDEDSRDEALIAVAKLAPGIQIDDEIEVA